MRLYRGLKSAYRPELVSVGRFSSTDFTDGSATALLYARGARGVLLVADIPASEDVATAPRVTEELWFVKSAKRFMVWGPFDPFVTTILEAKDLRACLRRSGLRDAPSAVQAQLLASVIEDEISASAALGCGRTRRPS